MRMTQSECFTALRRLENAFGHKMKEAQAMVWHDKLKNWPLVKLERVVDILLTTGDKFPALALLFRAGDTISNEAILPPKTECLMCQGTGCVSAEKFDVGAKERPYVFAFRCPACRNWEGRQGERIPMWSSEAKSRGFKLCTEHLDDISRADLETLREFAPRMFNDFLSRHPEWADDFQPVEFEKSTWNEMPGPKLPTKYESPYSSETPEFTRDDTKYTISTEGEAAVNFIEMSQPPEPEEEWVPR